MEKRVCDREGEGIGVAPVQVGSRHYSDGKEICECCESLAIHVLRSFAAFLDLKVPCTRHDAVPCLKGLSIALHCIVLYCIVLYCIVLYCIVLYCIVLYCIVLYCYALHCIVLYCIVLYCIVLNCIALHCSVLHCFVLHRIVSYRIVSHPIMLNCIVSHGIALWFCVFRS